MRGPSKPRGKHPAPAAARNNRHSAARRQHTGDPAAPAARGAEQARQHISSEAARIMAEEGVRDFQAAKRKAAARLNQSATRNLPSNQEIEHSLAEYLSLFHGDRLPHMQQHLRTLAVEAMQFLAPFDPRLVGAVLSGTVTPYSEIQIHVSADTPEQVAWHLQDHQIPYEEGDKRLRFGGDRQQTLPSFRFVADETPIELTVFSPASAREAPLSPVDGRPMKRAALKELEQLLGTRP